MLLNAARNIVSNKNQEDPREHMEWLYVGWTRKVISRGFISRYLGALLSCYITPKQVFNWVQ